MLRQVAKVNLLGDIFQGECIQYTRLEKSVETSPNMKMLRLKDENRMNTSLSC